MFHMQNSKVARRFYGFDNLAEKIWWIKVNIRIKTFLTQLCIENGKDALPPPGLAVVIPNISNELLSLAREEIRQLFESERRLPKTKRLPHAVYDSRGLYYIFGTPDKFIDYGQGISFLHRRGVRHLEEFCRGYADILCRATNIPMHVFENNCMLLLLQYEPKYGLWLHVDNVARTDGGLIATISLGPPDVNIDFVPILQPSPEKQPSRINIDEGEMLVMQGESRLEWAHGIPYGLPTKKYTVMFKVNNLPGLSKQVGYSGLLDTPMFSFDLHG